MDKNEKLRITKVNDALSSISVAIDHINLNNIYLEGLNDYRSVIIDCASLMKALIKQGVLSKELDFYNDLNELRNSMAHTDFEYHHQKINPFIVKYLSKEIESFSCALAHKTIGFLMENPWFNYELFPNTLDLISSMDQNKVMQQAKI